MPALTSASSSGHGRGWGCPQGLGGARNSQGGRADPNPTLRLCPCRYTGERPTTNMVVIEAKLPSGYIPAKSSVVEVRSPPLPPGTPLPHWGTHPATKSLSLGGTGTWSGTHLGCWPWLGHAPSSWCPP